MFISDLELSIHTYRQLEEDLSRVIKSGGPKNLELHSDSLSNSWHIFHHHHYLMLCLNCQIVTSRPHNLIIRWDFKLVLLLLLRCAYMGNSGKIIDILEWVVVHDDGTNSWEYSPLWSLWLEEPRDSESIKEVFKGRNLSRCAKL